MAGDTSEMSDAQGNDIEYILKVARENQVKFIRLWFTDILGFQKSMACTIAQLEDTLLNGASFDGSSIQGFARWEERDMRAKPDPATFHLLPWRKGSQGAVAGMVCDIVQPDGTPYEGDPRWVLRRVLQRAAGMGFNFYVGPELEFFYFRSSRSPETLDEGGYFDLTAQDVATDIRRDTILTLEEMGIDVDFSHHEAAHSQHEIDLRYADAMTMADYVMMFRTVVKEIAQKYGVYATFMPKPLQGQNGSGMHINTSLFHKSENAFFDANDPHHLSETARRYIAGILTHIQEITLVTNQWVNSYKRLAPGYEAPTHVSWARQNRSDLVRVPTYIKGREDGLRVELRSPDPACNPYLAFACLLSAGLDGIEKGYALAEPLDRSVADMGEEERAKLGIKSLPVDLHAAIEAAEGSELMRRTLGEHVFNNLIANKRLEWNRYRGWVTDFELQEYLPLL
jgi:glutamine synthetase